MYNNVIYVDEKIIGYPQDIIHDIETYEFNDEDEKSIFDDLIEELKKHDDLVLCEYHPMGSYGVWDLVLKTW